MNIRHLFSYSRLSFAERRLIFQNATPEQPPVVPEASPVERKGAIEEKKGGPDFLTPGKAKEAMSKANEDRKNQAEQVVDQVFKNLQQTDKCPLWIKNAKNIKVLGPITETTPRQGPDAGVTKQIPETFRINVDGRRISITADDVSFKNPEEMVSKLLEDIKNWETLDKFNQGEGVSPKDFNAMVENLKKSPFSVNVQVPNRTPGEKK